MECAETIFSAPSTCHRVESHLSNLLGSLPLLSLDKSALKVAKRKLGTHKREKKRSTLIFYAR
ncbi:hypothetical protein G4B88_019752 [Cannabis sativa]|uniref:Uncharacterized protein n=1 Tax=Cannabis sativa TaxID=3483 RepID=A0A7J6HT44_CANSA|nr:hypothetical protein G4B88_019752 [Cannabis sativa]